MEGMTKIILYIIPLIVLVLLGFFYFGPSGALDKLKGSAETLKDYVPDVSMGADQLTAKEAGVPSDHKNAINSLKNTLEKMTQSTGPCFAYYKEGGLPELNEQGTSITFSYDPVKDETIVTTYGGTAGKQIVTDLSFTIPKMELCVIADENIVKSFGDRYLNDKTWAEKLASPSDTIRKVNSIKIEYSTNKLNGHTIRAPELGADTVNDESNNLQDYGVVYTPDGSSICFFPTVYGNNVCDGSDKDGLDDDCLGADPNEDISIPRQISEGKLKKCF